MEPLIQNSLRQFVTTAGLLAAAVSTLNAGTPLGTSITYQGQLKQHGAPVTGTRDFSFTLWDAAQDGIRIGPSVSATDVPVSGGVFEVRLDFGAGAFRSEARWLQVVVNGEVLNPRQALTAAPFAHFAGAPWATVAGGLSYGAGNVGVGTANPQRLMHLAGSPHPELRLQDTGLGGKTFHVGVNSSDGSLRIAESGVADRLVVDANGNVGIGTAAPSARLHVDGNVRVTNDSSILGLDQLVGFNDLRLYGDGTGGPDLVVAADGRVGHRSNYSNVSFNIRGGGSESQILRVETVLGSSILEVQADHDVAVSGDFFVVNGSKDFRIDHPLDPEKKILAHNAVEGPGYFTHYHGTVVLGSDGTAWVGLPDYFEALNGEPCYQLSCVGGYAPVYVAREVENNRFQIAGGREGLKVCWQVSASRRDPYVRDNPYRAVREKSVAEQGRYLYPEGYGQPPEKGISYQAPNPEQGGSSATAG